MYDENDCINLKVSKCGIDYVSIPICVDSIVYFWYSLPSTKLNKVMKYTSYFYLLVIHTLSLFKLSIWNFNILRLLSDIYRIQSNYEFDTNSFGCVSSPLFFLIILFMCETLVSIYVDLCEMCSIELRYEIRMHFHLYFFFFFTLT